VIWLAAAVASPPPVIGGQPAPTGRWPDAVALFSGTQHTCTGTLIAPDLILSAEHCFGITHAVLGSVDYTTGESIEIVERFNHPDASATFDVALFRLATASDLPPRELLVDCLSDFYVDGAIATVAGFGYRDPNGPGQSLLIEVDLPLEDADCSELDRGCRPAVSPGGELVAGGGGVDSCIGDSGGPLYLDTGAGVYLAGVVSRGSFPADQLCGDGGIYVRTDAIAPWIEQVSGTLLPRPADCEDFNRPPRPTAELLELTQGRSAPLQVDPNDPDPGDSHQLIVVEGPERGFVSDELVFTAEPFQVGPDRIVIEVVDDGTPSQRATIAVDIAVYPAGRLDEPIEPFPAGCGCSTPAPATAGFSLFSRRRR